MKFNHAPATLFTAIIFGCAIVLLLMKGADLFKQQLKLGKLGNETYAQEQIKQDYVLIPAHADKQEAQGPAPGSLSQSNRSLRSNDAQGDHLTINQ